MNGHRINMINMNKWVCPKIGSPTPSISQVIVFTQLGHFQGLGRLRCFAVAVRAAPVKSRAQPVALCGGIARSTGLSRESTGYLQFVVVSLETLWEVTAE